jgi:predicted nucleic acid-binding protein
MIAILDVSGAIEILLKKEKKEKFEQTFKNASWVVSPDLFVPEISNVLWKYYKAKVISHEDCIQFVEDGINMVDDFIDGGELWKEALGEGIKYDHSMYDMYYAVSARRNDAILITNDGPLAKICKELRIELCY